MFASESVSQTPKINNQPSMARGSDLRDYIGARVDGESAWFDQMGWDGMCWSYYH